MFFDVLNLTSFRAFANNNGMLSSSGTKLSGAINRVFCDVLLFKLINCCPVTRSPCSLHDPFPNYYYFCGTNYASGQKNYGSINWLRFFSLLMYLQKNA